MYSFPANAAPAVGGIVSEFRIDPTARTVSFAVLRSPGRESGAEWLRFSFEGVSEFRMARDSRPGADHYTELTDLGARRVGDETEFYLEFWSRNWGEVTIRCARATLDGVDLTAGDSA